ncbi:hypothetical protein FRC12_017889 [Ceratobasidium sp. 428]|nr:hypothetical protein FRC12_017889 [Ceratobasidium sp. 428]
MFLELARAKIDWESSWIPVNDLYAILNQILQKNDDDSMDLDDLPGALQNVVSRLEMLTISPIKCNNK